MRLVFDACGAPCSYGKISMVDVTCGKCQVRHLEEGV